MIASNRGNFDFKPFVPALVPVVLCLALFACTASSASAAEQYLFDPTLSLTGSCSTEELDQVPDPWCPGPPAPSAPFANPSITIDSYGDMYVSNHAGETGAQGWVDVFSPTGNFITEIAAPGARSLAVDGEGHLYVLQSVIGGGTKIVRFSPTLYEPSDEKIEYEDPGEVVLPEVTPDFCAGSINPFTGLAVDPITDRLYVSPSHCVGEFSSASAPEPNKLLDDSIGNGVLTQWSSYIAVDAAHNRLYVADGPTGTKGRVEVFELNSPHTHLGALTGAATPAGEFRSGVGKLTMDANEETGHLFVSDVNRTPKVYEMGPGVGAGEEYFATFEHEFSATEPGEIAVDNSSVSPNQGSFFVPSSTKQKAPYHTYAFKAVEIGPPEVESVSATEVTTSEAVLRARINPNGGTTTYRLEYTAFADEDFSEAKVAGEGSIQAGIVGVDVSAPATNLAPGALYRFRAVAENDIGEDALGGSFRTYVDVPIGGPCPNDVFRTGFSAMLPDCRAYELVSPPDTNGRSPIASGGTGIYFPTLQVSPQGDKAHFLIEGGSLPDTEGAGPFQGENYLSTRGTDGWSTELAGPSGTESEAPQPGAFSPDQGYSFWSGVIPGELTLNPHIRYPDGHSELVGRGSLGEDPRASAQLISENASHVIFTTLNLPKPAPRLEPEAPPTGTTAVYDRTPDEVTHVVSLLPGDVTPAAGQNAVYVGASYDGEGVAFKIGATLYLRHDNEETYAVGTGVTFAGIAEGGGRIFYLQGGNLFALDTASGDKISFSKGGDTTPVNVSADGSTAYFVSPDVLIASQNPQGVSPQNGKENLYVSREGVMSFVGIVNTLDVASEPLYNDEIIGLGRWVKSLELDKPAIATSRTTPDGDVFLFESQANLTGYDPEGHIQVYRYDARVPSLSCLSCNPTGAAATSDASLQTIKKVEAPQPPVISVFVRIPNLRPDGERMFFQSFEALVPTDVDNRQDVYEWEAPGVGSCTQPEGCLYLITSGQSGRDEHLFGHSTSGDDVFFLSSEILLPNDRERTPSVYDARVGGGFPQPVPTECLGEGCRSTLTPPPLLPAPASPTLGSSGNVNKACPKGKRKVRRGGKVRCVKKKRHRNKNHRRASKGRAGK